MSVMCTFAVERSLGLISGLGLLGVAEATCSPLRKASLVHSWFQSP